jgi:elongator complex protein 4
MLRYFIAEGVVNDHSIFIASQDTNPSQIVSELPAVVENYTKVKDNSESSKEMKIAWRYKHMKLTNSVGDNFAHYYDLTKPMDKESLEKVNVKLWDGENVERNNYIFENSAYMDLLLNIEKSILEGHFLISQTSKKRSILRIAINSLGSRLWLSDSEDKSQKDLLKFMYMLKALLRQSFTVAVVTIPVLNFANDSVK